MVQTTRAQQNFGLRGSSEKRLQKKHSSLHPLLQKTLLLPGNDTIYCTPKTRMTLLTPTQPKTGGDYLAILEKLFMPKLRESNELKGYVSILFLRENQTISLPNATP